MVSSLSGTRTNANLLFAIEGSCACGDVTVKIERDADCPSDEALVLWYCCCTSCCKASGSLLASYIRLPKSALWHDPKSQTIEYRASHCCIRKHCGRCGTTLAHHESNGDNKVQDIPAALFLSDNDDSVTNALISSRLEVRGYFGIRDQEDLCLGKLGGGLTALLQYDEWPKSAVGHGTLDREEYIYKEAAARTTVEQRIKISCHCKGVRLTVPYKSEQEGASCACISCCKISGGLLWSAVRYPLDQVAFETDRYLANYGSRHFCTRCGALVFWQLRPGYMSISLALFEDYAQFRTVSGSFSYEFLADQKGLRLPTAAGQIGPDGGLAAVIRDPEQTKWWQEDVDGIKFEDAIRKLSSA